MRPTSKTALYLSLGAAGVFSTLLLASPAFAEGSWTSSVSQAVTGFSSRSWQDNQSDSASTITTLSGCSIQAARFSSISLDLYDEFGAFPDFNVGTKTSNCGTHNWGRMTRPDQYHWTISAVNGGTSSYPVSISKVVQAY